MDSNSVLAVGPSALRKVGGMSSGPAAPFLRMVYMAMSRRAELKMAVEEFSFRSGDCSRKAVPYTRSAALHFKSLFTAAKQH